VTTDSSDIFVEYHITLDNWELTETHLYLKNTPPKKHAPGRFPYKVPDVQLATYQLYQIPIPVDPVIFISAHGVVIDKNTIIGYDHTTIVGYDCITNYGDYLPETIDFQTSSPVYNENNYFYITIVSSIWNGIWGIWCIDSGHRIRLNRQFSGHVYSSYDDLPGSIVNGTNPHVDSPQHLDVINWIINQNDLGDSFDVQNAIWTILDDDPIHECDSLCQDIVNVALLEGQGFIPTVGDYIGIILEPDNDKQNLIIPILLEADTCDPIYQPIYSDETIWALGENTYLFSKGWGGYFEISV
jgi:hypothetical protein